MAVSIVDVTYNLEANMRAVSDDEFARFQDPLNVWWDEATARITTGSKKQIMTWFLSSAQLYDQGTAGGNFDFADPLMLETDFTVKTAGAAMRLQRQQLEDIDNNTGVAGGEGIRAAVKWAADMGHQFGYWPQQQIANLIINGATTAIAPAYDGLSFFNAAHYCNGKDSSDGTFSNLLDGASYQIDSSVTDDTILANLAAVYQQIRGIKFPTGQPRMLRPAAILAGPALYPRLARLLDAKFIAANASVSGAGGTADVAGYVGRMGFGRVIEAPELTAAEWSKFAIVLVERGPEADLGAFMYIDREPFTIRYYTGRGGGVGVDAMLDRADQLEWHASGRNVAGYGHPFLAVKFGKT